MAKQRKAPAKRTTPKATATKTPSKRSKVAPSTSKPSTSKPSKSKPSKSTKSKPKTSKPPKPVKVPDYADVLHTEAGELVMSTPVWFDEDDDKARIATVLVDARTWPPTIVSHAMRSSAAARLPDGRWVCAAKIRGAWQLAWFANIASKQPARLEPPPFEAPPPKRDDDDDRPRDPGPIARLHSFASTLLAIPFEGPVYARTGDGPWREHPALQGQSRVQARNVTIDGNDFLEWSGALYDSALRRVDALDCTHFMSRGDRVFAIHHGSNLVELAGGTLTSCSRVTRWPTSCPAHTTR